MERPGLTEEIAFPVIPQSSLTDAPIILEGTIEGYHVRRIYVDGGSSSEIMYGHCFKSFGADIKSRLRKAITPLVGFSAPQGTQPSADVGKRRRKDKITYRGGCNRIEVYLEEIVVKSKTEENLVKDVEEMLDKPQRWNVKIDPSKCTFRIEEAEISSWTIEATESFQKIKRRLTKLSMLAVPKEGELANVDDRNLLHSDREGGPDISPHDKVPEDNFPKAQSQSGNRWPHGRNAKTLWYRRTIGKMGSGIENISCLIRPKEGSRGASGEKILRTGRTSATYVG
ncbi:hypothetical protein Tco_1408649 [Tanacetum coccineum]